MKWLFYAFLVLNAIVAWQIFSRENFHTEQVEISEPTKTETKTVKQETDETVNSCWALGPVFSTATTRRIRDSIKEFDLNPFVLKEIVNESAKYLVYVPAKNGQQARKLMTRLEEFQVPGYIIKKGELRNNISIASYAEGKKAEAMVDLMFDRGFGAKIKEKRTTKTHYWIVTARKIDRPLDNRIHNSARTAAPGARVEIRTCRKK